MPAASSSTTAMGKGTINLSAPAAALKTVLPDAPKADAPLTASAQPPQSDPANGSNPATTHRVQGETSSQPLAASSPQPGSSPMPDGQPPPTAIPGGAPTASLDASAPASAAVPSQTTASQTAPEPQATAPMPSAVGAVPQPAQMATSSTAATITPPTTAALARGPRAAMEPGDDSRPQGKLSDAPGQAPSPQTPSSVDAAPVATAAPVARSGPTHAPSPAEQVVPTVLTLAKASNGTREMTVRLQPAELGMVQVTIARTLSGATQIAITADNPATLLALQRDQPQLQHSLDQAGVPASGRTITFHAAAEAAGGGGGGGTGASTGHGTSHQGSSDRGHTGTADANAGGGRGGYAGRQRTTYSSAGRSSAPLSTGATVATATRTYRAGLDITA